MIVGAKGLSVTVTFGRIGRVFLLSALGSAVAALVCLLVLTGTARTVVVAVLSGLALLAVLQGVVWTVVQHRMFGSVAALRRVVATGPRTIATVVAVRGTASRIGAEPIALLDLLIDGSQVSRHVRIPFNRAADVRAGRELPVRTDPAGSRAMVVEWDRLP